MKHTSDINCLISSLQKSMGISCREHWTIQTKQQRWNNKRKKPVSSEAFMFPKKMEQLMLLCLLCFSGGPGFARQRTKFHLRLPHRGVHGCLHQRCSLLHCSHQASSALLTPLLLTETQLFCLFSSTKFS